MSKMKRIKEINDVAGPQWWDGRSCYKENLDRWSQRATANSITPQNQNKFRAASHEEPELPSTVSRNGPDPHRNHSGDMRKEALRDTNHRTDDPYMSKVRRTT
jgi:hypothetical protein